MKRRPKHPVIVYGIIASVHLNIAWITWRDIRIRPDDKVRGPKRVWRLASAVNTLGSMAYWTLARR